MVFIRLHEKFFLSNGEGFFSLSSIPDLFSIGKSKEAIKFRGWHKWLNAAVLNKD